MVVLPKLDTPPKVYREFVAEGMTKAQKILHAELIIIQS